MKLATMNDGSRDGKLAVVSNDLTRYTDASFLVPTLQAALDNWMRVAPHLAAMAESLETGAVPSLRFHEHDAHSPLPRAYQWVDVGPRGQVQRASDAFVGPRDAIDAAGDLRCIAKVAVIVDDVALGASLDEARDAIRLVLLLNDVTAGTSISASFSPVAVTPDQLDNLWARGRLASAVQIDIDSKQTDAESDAGKDHDLANAVFQAAKTRNLGAGTIVSVGPSGIGEGVALNSGSTIRIEMKDRSGHSVFGAIEQTNGLTD